MRTCRPSAGTAARYGGGAAGVQRLTGASLTRRNNPGGDRQMQVQAGNTKLSTGILQIAPRFPGGSLTGTPA